MTNPRCCLHLNMIIMITGRGQEIFKDSGYTFDETASSSSSSEEDETGVAVDAAADASAEKGSVAGTATAADGAATAAAQPAEGEEAPTPNNAAADAPLPCPPAATPELPTMADVSSLVGAPLGAASVSASESTTATSEGAAVVA